MKIKVSYTVDVDIPAWENEYGTDTYAEAVEQVMTDLVSWAPLYVGESKWQYLAKVDAPGVHVSIVEAQR